MRSDGNGNPPEAELELNQEASLKILNRVYQGQNNNRKFFLYSVTDLDTDETKSFFAPDGIHSIIQDWKLGGGGEFLLKPVQNRKKGSSKLELSILDKAPEPVQPNGDSYKELLLRCIRGAADIVKESRIQSSNDELQKLATTQFIQRTRLVGSNHVCPSLWEVK